jgi:hypothetical protein
LCSKSDTSLMYIKHSLLKSNKVFKIVFFVLIAAQLVLTYGDYL